MTTTTHPLRRIIKLQLKDGEDRTLNPVSSFTRFGCWAHGPRSYLAVLRGLFAVAIGITIFVDWGLSDSLARYKRGATDGDSVWFWLRPQDWIHACVVIMFALAIVASGFKREDAETETSHPLTYLVIWNLMLVVLPLSAASFILYNHVLRWSHSYDAAYEATVYQTFIVCLLELIWGGWPADWIDVALPCIIAGLFIVYTLVLSKVWNTDLYVQLDWAKDPQTAVTNSVVFMITVASCALVSTGFAIKRNQCFNRRGGVTYSKLEVAPLNTGKV